MEFDQIEPWPSLETRATGDRLRDGPFTWIGSLVTKDLDPTGLMYRRNQYYDPMAGQFTQEDPIGIAGGVNFYGYAGGDPVNFSDPSGLCPEDIPDGHVCLDLFIEALVASFWEGDGRGFDTLASMWNSRVQIVVGPDGILFQHASPSCFLWDDALEDCADPTLNTSFSTGRDRSFTVEYSATNNRRIAGWPNPSTNGRVTFYPDGNGGYTTSGSRDPFPSLGIYQRQGGEWVPMPGGLRSAGVLGPLGLYPPAPNDVWGGYVPPWRY